MGVGSGLNRRSGQEEKKIAILLPSLPVYRKDFFERLHISLSSNNIEFIVFHGVSNIKVIKDDEQPSYSTYKLKTRETSLFGFRLGFQQDLFKKIEEMKPDGVIVLFNPGILSYWRVLLYCLSKKVPYALWGSGYVRPGLGRFRRKVRKTFVDYFDSRAKVHITYGRTKESILIQKGIKRNSIFVAQNTINVEKIIAEHSKLGYNRFGDKLRILFVGAIIENKKLHATILAIGSLIQEGLNIQYDIVGGGHLVDELKKEIESLKLNDFIRIHGAKYGAELTWFFRNSELFLLAGSGGLAVNEAMAYGLPIISTVGDGTISDLIDGNGFLLNASGDIEEIKVKIKQFYFLSKEQKREMSERSVQIIFNNASLENMVKNYRQAVFHLLSVNPETRQSSEIKV